MSYDLERANRADRDIPHDQPPFNGDPVSLGKITTATASIGPGLYLLWNPVTALGDEVEGGTPTFEVDTGSSLVGRLLRGTPAQDDIVLFEWVDYEWVTEVNHYWANLTGQVDGCSGFGWPNAPVEIRLQSTGALLKSLTADSSGAYSTSIKFPAPPPVTLLITAFSTGAYANYGASASVTKSVSIGANTVPTIAIPPVGNYCCVPGTIAPAPLSGTICCEVLQGPYAGIPPDPHPIAGATVSFFRNTGGPALGTATTNASGIACITVGIDATYIMNATKAGWHVDTNVGSQRVQCSGVTTAPPPLVYPRILMTTDSGIPDP